MKVKLPLTGPLKWLFILGFVWAWPTALVYAFQPNTDEGKSAFHLLALYFCVPIIAMLALALVSFIEQAWKSRKHWQENVREPGTRYLLSGQVATLVPEGVAYLLLAFVFNAMVCIVAATVVQASLKFL
jgi:hypothetical protein